MRITRSESEWLGWDDPPRVWIADDSPEAAEIASRRAARGQKVVEPSRAAFSYQPHVSQPTGLPAHLRGLRPAFSSDSLIEDTRMEGK